MRNDRGPYLTWVDWVLISYISFFTILLVGGLVMVILHIIHHLADSGGNG